MNDREFIAIAKETAHGSKLATEAAYTQHGDTSCLTHSVAVAYYSCRLAERLGGAKRFEMRQLARGALLHDYFLYDWHEKSVIPPPPEGLHGFSHPLTAHRNAKRDFDLTALEENIIANHMFPLTLLHMPTRRESDTSVRRLLIRRRHAQARHWHLVRRLASRILAYRRICPSMGGFAVRHACLEPVRTSRRRFATA